MDAVALRAKVAVLPGLGTGMSIVGAVGGAGTGGAGKGAAVDTGVAQISTPLRRPLKVMSCPFEIIGNEDESGT